jgi:ABC-type multidrug transport system ATPase subunit
VDGIQISYNGKLLLSDVYLKCETNEIIGLLGTNGSGKSTLLKIIFGLVSAPNKCIRIDGISVKNKNRFDEIGYLHQDQFIPNHLTVKKAISLAIDEKEMEVFCEDKMIESILRKRIKCLSSGELRYLEIKIVLFNSSRFVLLDEPYNGLAPLMIDVVNEMILNNADKKGIIITDHNYQNVLKISNHLVLIKDGKTHHLKEKKELVEKGYLLNSSFL